MSTSAAGSRVSVKIDRPELQRAVEEFREAVMTNFQLFLAAADKGDRAKEVKVQTVTLTISVDDTPIKATLDYVGFDIFFRPVSAALSFVGKAGRTISFSIPS